MSGHTNFENLRAGLRREFFTSTYDPATDNFIDLADRWRDDVAADALSLYYKYGIIDSDQLKARIQECIEIADVHYKPDVRGLKLFLEYITRTGERGPVEDWPVQQ